MPTTCCAAAALCALVPLVIGPSADAISAPGAFVPPPALPQRRPTKQTCAGARAGTRHASRCRSSMHVCSMSQGGNDDSDYSDNGPTRNERTGRQRYTPQKRASPPRRGGRGDGRDDGLRRRRKGRPRQNRRDDDGGDRGGRTSRSNRRNTSSWPRYKSEIDAALEITDADADAFEASIDSFLDGEYSQPFAEEAPAPHPGLTPRETLDCALRSLRRMDEPYENHGAAVFMRFCVPLTNSERWGLSNDLDPWKTILRGALSPNMLARQLRASSSFASLLDWKRLDVSDGFAIPSDRRDLGVGTTLAFVNAALYFQEGEPAIVQFTLRKIGGAWMIDDAVVSQRDWFVSPQDDNDSEEEDSRDDSGIGGGKGMP